MMTVVGGLVGSSPGDVLMCKETASMWNMLSNHKTSIVGFQSVDSWAGICQPMAVCQTTRLVDVNSSRRSMGLGYERTNNKPNVLLVNWTESGKIKCLYLWNIVCFTRWWWWPNWRQLDATHIVKWHELSLRF